MSQNPSHIAPDIVIAIDPGRQKCGLAVVGAGPSVLVSEIVSRQDLPSRVASLAATHPGAQLICGDGTGSRQVVGAICHRCPDLSIELVDERHSSMEARHRFLILHPPKGLRRLVPVGLRWPDKPYDDLVAVILAERRLALIGLSAP